MLPPGRLWVAGGAFPVDPSRVLLAVHCHRRQGVTDTVTSTAHGGTGMGTLSAARGQLSGPLRRRRSRAQAWHHVLEDVPRRPL